MNFLSNLDNREIGIDLGTANILVALKRKGIVYREPSVVALDKQTKEVLAFGNQAKLMLGRTPEKIEAIQDVKNHRYSEEALNNYFHENKEFKTGVLQNVIATLPTEECMQELLENGYFLDEEKMQIFSSETDYLKHLKYLNSTPHRNRYQQ